MSSQSSGRRRARPATGLPTSRPFTIAEQPSTRSRGRHRLPSRRSRRSRGRRILRGLAIGVAVLVGVTGVGGFVAYRHLNGNITVLDTSTALGTDRPEAVAVHEDAPTAPLNILLIGSDTRQGEGNDVGGETPGLSDTTILLHLSADRERAYAVSIPRDSMVERPTCLTQDGEGTDPGGLSMFNAAYAVGGPACTQRTVEQLTGVRIDHFAVVDFSGFRHMVDALGGVPICVPETVSDPVSGAHFDAGTYEVSGEQALNYVRIRHAISDNGDIGRMARQQAFLAAMVRTAISSDTLTSPTRLYSFLDATTESLTTDPGLGNLTDLASLARQVQNIGLGNVQFLTVPFEPYAPDPNRVAWSPEAVDLWERLALDLPLTAEQVSGAIAATGRPAVGVPVSQTASATADPAAATSGTTGDTDGADRAADDRMNGLCSTVG